MALQPNEVKTEHIAPGAVTTPKIADEAVTTAKIKDSAIKTEKIATGAVTGSKIGEGQIYGSKLRAGAVRAEKIAAGAIVTSKIGEAQVTASRLADKSVTTEKLASGAVTTEKIANASVTPAKLSFTPPAVARPITPPVATAEIGDAQVTPAKLSFIPVARPLVPPIVAAELAGDSVETDKIKDGAVTPAKLSFVPGVTRPLVPPVATDEIADGAVTEPKLAETALSNRLIAGYLQRQCLFLDEFLGAALDTRWVESGTPGGKIEAMFYQGRNVVTGPNSNDVYRLSFGGIVQILYSSNPYFSARLATSMGNVLMLFGLFYDIDHYIGFRANTSLSPNWFTVTRAGGVDVETDTNLAIGSTIRDYSFVIDGTHSAKFYIDGVLKATHATHIPAQRFEPIFEVKTIANAVKKIEINKMFVLMDKLT